MVIRLKSYLPYVNYSQFQILLVAGEPGRTLSEGNVPRSETNAKSTPHRLDIFLTTDIIIINNLFQARAHIYIHTIQEKT